MLLFLLALLPTALVSPGAAADEWEKASPILNVTPAQVADLTSCARVLHQSLGQDGEWSLNQCVALKERLKDPAVIAKTVSCYSHMTSKVGYGLRFFGFDDGYPSVTEDCEKPEVRDHSLEIIQCERNVASKLGPFMDEHADHYEASPFQECFKPEFRAVQNEVAGCALRLGQKYGIGKNGLTVFSGVGLCVEHPELRSDPTKFDRCAATVFASDKKQDNAVFESLSCADPRMQAAPEDVIACSGVLAHSRGEDSEGEIYDWCLDPETRKLQFQYMICESNIRYYGYEFGKNAQQTCMDPAFLLKMRKESTVRDCFATMKRDFGLTFDQAYVRCIPGNEQSSDIQTSSSELSTFKADPHPGSGQSPHDADARAARI